MPAEGSVSVGLRARRGSARCGVGKRKGRKRSRTVVCDDAEKTGRFGANCAARKQKPKRDKGAHLLRQMISACDTGCAGAGFAFEVVLGIDETVEATGGDGGAGCPFTSLISSAEDCFFFFAIFSRDQAVAAANSLTARA